MFEHIEYKAGATKEIINCYPKGYRKGADREIPIRKKTKEEIREANRRQATRELERLMNANFRPGDLHVVLTYRKEIRPSPKKARKELKNFLDRMRGRYRKHGQELKYIVATEYLAKHIHHHLVINNINTGTETTADMIRKLWTERRGKDGIRGNPKFVQLYDTGEYSQLADYLIKETDRTFRREDSAVGQRYSCSRNLVRPEKKVTERPAKKWRRDPKPHKGYYILPESVYNGRDIFGYPYQRYVMVKLNPSEKDWERKCPPSGMSQATRSHSTSHRPRAGGERSGHEKEHEQSRKRDYR